MFMIVVLIGGILWLSRGTTADSDASAIPASIEKRDDSSPHDSIKEKEADITKETLVVDVKGAVRKPGVFEMKSGQRVNDVVQLAGGFSEDADVNSVNLAQVLVDEMVIYVAKVGEEALPVVSNEKEDGKIDINRAEDTELETIPGIGPSKAGAIIAYREENGPFSSIDELVNVPGIGQKTLEQLKEYITAGK
ncbi:helix-hairpin-helix domain-containing protein [Pseudalkalibacillus salsuginis]|uniref:helix-hairpin-helix domain-containing protein n=1 Tax=Pseudalkalibacillus salsuginis TaxID=2910972 RepID=UPI001F1D5AD9|nr:helix-hairpin-helix domain-containing protein [Pseudalkalibacillus salsuginis]MCF6408556.1 helix-hairpin-helix domain-containing protein [Pseudalkalibacillus salsuginis]